MVIYQGPIKDNTGKVVIPGRDRAEAAPHDIASSERCDYLVDGVVGDEQTPTVRPWESV